MQHRGDDEMHADERERVAVRRGLGHHRVADSAARARTVVDDHRLTPRFGDFLPDHARHHIRRSARRNGDDGADGLGRILLRRHAVSSERKNHSKQEFGWNSFHG